MRQSDWMLFAGTSNRELAQRIANSLDVQLGKLLIETFPDGEIGVQILENVRGRDVFVLQSVARHPNLYLMELLILIDALKRASARSIVAVIPYYGYARQDRKDKGRVPITAKLVANMLETAGATRVLTMDLHAEQLQGFFDIPVDNLYARKLLVQEVEKLKLEPTVVVAPDVGSARLARSFAEDLGVDYAIVDKRRINAQKVEVNTIIGDVGGGKTVLLVDDMCTTGGTLYKASWECKKHGAGKIFAAVTHGPMIGKAFEESAIEKMLICDTVQLDPSVDPRRVQLVSIAPLFAQAIESIVSAKSISSLFVH